MNAFSFTKAITFLVLVFLISTNSFAQVVINEVHYNPANDITGDANKDGTRSSSQDEFVELVNGFAVSMDISGWSISDADGVCFIIPNRTILKSNQALVVFGGGSPTGNFGDALILTKNLGLNNTDNYVVLKNELNEKIDSVFYKTSFAIGKSFTRYPDITGNFVTSTSIGDGSILYSPGFTADLKLFTTITGLFYQIDNSSPTFYPNPITDAIYILHSIDNVKKITLYDSKGVLVTENTHDYTLEIPEKAENGIYILRIETGKEVITEKVILLKK